MATVITIYPLGTFINPLIKETEEVLGRTPTIEDFRTFSYKNFFHALSMEERDAALQEFIELFSIYSFACARIHHHSRMRKIAELQALLKNPTIGCPPEYQTVKRVEETDLFRYSNH